MSLMLEGRAAAIERDHNDRAWLAWHVAALSRQKRLAPLRSLLSDRMHPRKVQDWRTQLETVKLLHAVFS
jgi:hypothetical protein